MLASGARAPDFSLEGAGGRRFTLQELLAEGPVALAFFKSSCPVCQFTFPFLERLHREGDGVRFFAVSQDNEPTTQRFIEEYGLTFPVLLDRFDEGYPASNAYGIRAVPSLFLIEPDGTISLTMEGFEKAALEELSARVQAQPFREGENVPVFRPG